VTFLLPQCQHGWKDDAMVQSKDTGYCAFSAAKANLVLLADAFVRSSAITLAQSRQRILSEILPWTADRSRVPPDWAAWAKNLSRRVGGRTIHRTKNVVGSNDHPLFACSMTLNGKIAVITGASLGIGRATAIAMAADRIHLVPTARSSDKLRELAKTSWHVTGRCR
jgi:short chain dehydrogenase